MFALPFCHGPATPRLADPIGLAAAVLALTALAVVPLGTAVSPAPAVAAPSILIVQEGGASLPALRDAAEAVRARLLTVPGVGAVRQHGLLTTGLEVDYAPARLARLGVTAADLRAALPAQARSAPGRIALRPEAVQDGPQPIADRVVHASGRTYRLGDIATVTRVAIDPVSILAREGHPAVALEIVPAGGTAAATLDRRVAARLDGAAPAGVALR